MRFGKRTEVISVCFNLLVAVACLFMLLSYGFSFAQSSEPVVLAASSTYRDPEYTDPILQQTAGLINKERENGGLTPLGQSSRLDNIAQKRANDMASHGYYSHLGSDGKYFNDIMQEEGIGYHFACENLDTLEISSAQGYVNAWLNSPAHKKCLLKDSNVYAGYATAMIPSVNGIPLNQKVIVAIYSDTEN